MLDPFAVVKKTKELVKRDDTDLSIKSALLVRIYVKGDASVLINGLQYDKGEGLSLGNPIYPEDFDLKIEWQGDTNRQLYVYYESLAKKNC